MLDPLVRLSPQDTIATARRDLIAGEQIMVDGTTVTIASAVPRGHKVAIEELTGGTVVLKYGQPIGVAATSIAPGEHVHTHNLRYEEGLSPEAPGATEPRLPEQLSPPPRFQGYRRADGRVGTRNYIGILTSVNCSASTAKMIADEFRGMALDAYRNVDGVVALTHQSGCGLVIGSEGADVLNRTLDGYARHPNFGGILVLGLGCEMLPVGAIGASHAARADLMVEQLIIQELGGVRKTVREGVERIKEMLPVVDQHRREACDVAELTVGLQCGGSDGYSGITANPALGYASDLVVAHGGTSVLSETPEIFGAEHLLIRRAGSPAVAEKVRERIEWWKRYTRSGGGSMDNNPSPGNKAGGLTTILEKSLGAVAKAGQAPLSAVYEYAEPITERGLCFMDTPGYDPVSATGQVAGGANLIVFTTGRGSVFGCRPVPSIKVSTNTRLAEAMAEDIDLNAGDIIDGDDTVESVGQALFDLMLATASGRLTASEEFPIGQEEFIPWQLGTVM